MHVVVTTASGVVMMLTLYPMCPVGWRHGTARDHDVGGKDDVDDEDGTCLGTGDDSPGFTHRSG